MPTLTLNGEPHDSQDAATVAALIESLELRPEQVAVELNRVIVSRSDYPTTVLNDGDQLEVVTFVGGG